ncbi:MAG TPA: hypothetical protein VHO06_04055 [Polyangia bacterium]|nr:hypothetical protein [Polyangia bacterium]
MTGDKGIARASAAAALLALSVSAGGCRQPGVPRVEPEVRALGAGVTLAIAADRPPAPLARRGLVPLWVTVTNQGPDPVRLRYRDFALADDDSLADAALLPAELGLPPASARLLPERLVGRGESASGFLYFRRPARPLSNLRVDLEAANETTISRSFVKLRVD